MIFEFIFFMIGSIPSGRLISFLFRKEDLRFAGSGNIGTSNAWRVNGKMVGSLTGIFDVLKGLSVIFSGSIFYYGMFVVLGNMFAPWSGGKGMAVFFGICLAFFGKIAFIFIFTWAFCVWIGFRPAHSSYISLLLVNLYFVLCVGKCISFLLIISLIILMRHLLWNKNFYNKDKEL
ncbi:glycerol-3-phosphate acyltransferase [Candidatus Nesciobacter abundans]|uniref:Glycerol-3-phosphate acyltransferase n=1 Tax=Candidatus Nesciobacter abundans TaxID=2601668 RepID=A0A5C0UJK7_9PROT|nr:glycerol-3-phosphate acyltransferase [Candidatus Nesciobacter abundans]QEK38994.1 glycerol-3-phosphate acyltransferase [Candidatus Nesciobacter abundans]